MVHLSSTSNKPASLIDQMLQLCYQHRRILIKSSLAAVIIPNLIVLVYFQAQIDTAISELIGSTENYLNTGGSVDFLFLMKPLGMLFLHYTGAELFIFMLSCFVFSYAFGTITQREFIIQNKFNILRYTLQVILWWGLALIIIFILSQALLGPIIFLLPQLVFLPLVAIRKNRSFLGSLRQVYRCKFDPRKLDTWQKYFDILTPVGFMYLYLIILITLIQWLSQLVDTTPWLTFLNTNFFAEISYKFFIEQLLYQFIAVEVFIFLVVWPLAHVKICEYLAADFKQTRT